MYILEYNYFHEAKKHLSRNKEKKKQRLLNISIYQALIDISRYIISLNPYEETEFYFILF